MHEHIKGAGSAEYVVHHPNKPQNNELIRILLRTAIQD